MTDAFLDVRTLQVRYGGATALDAVDLPVRRGEFVTLLGASGSGKTTLLMALAGFVRPTAGSVRLDGADLLALPPNRRDVSVVFQSYAVFPHMTVLGNVLFPLRVRRMPNPEADRRAREALDRVGLATLADRAPATLSGGQRQRVALARAIVAEPRLLLMDEPLSALDKNLRERMQVEIRGLHERLGLTTICVTHDQREALTMSDRVAVMEAGRIVQFDRPATLYRHPASAFVATFMGQANLVDPAELRAQGAEALRLTGSNGRRAVLRAEDMRPGPPPPGLDALWIEGRARRQLYQGDASLLIVELPSGGVVEARLPTRDSLGQPPPAPGQPVTLHVESGLVALVEGPL